MCDADAAWYHHMVHIIGFIRLTAVQQTLGGISLTLPAETVCNCIKPFHAYSLIFEIPACCTSAFVAISQHIKIFIFCFCSHAEELLAHQVWNESELPLWSDTSSHSAQHHFVISTIKLIKFKHFCNKIFLSKKWFHKRDFNEREEHGWVFDSSCLGESYLWRDW